MSSVRTLWGLLALRLRGLGATAPRSIRFDEAIRSRARDLRLRSGRPVGVDTAIAASAAEVLASVVTEVLERAGGCLPEQRPAAAAYLSRVFAAGIAAQLGREGYAVDPDRLGHQAAGLLQGQDAPSPTPDSVDPVHGFWERQAATAAVAYIWHADADAATLLTQISSALCRNHAGIWNA